jgi:hypothetical protein
MWLQGVHNEHVTAEDSPDWPQLAISILNHFGQQEPRWLTVCHQLSPPVSLGSG